MRARSILPLLALTACSSETPSGPTLARFASAMPAPSPTPTGPLPFEGAYELSLSIAPDCARGFPEALRVRRYDVLVFHASDHSELDFEDGNVADSIGDGPGYSSIGVARGFEARLSVAVGDLISYSDAGYPQILWVDSVTWDGGDSFVPASDSRLEGRLKGRIFYDAGSESAECASDHHGFVLAPR